MRAALMAIRCAASLMVAQKQGLIVDVGYLFDRYDGFRHYDVAPNRMAYDMAEDLRPYGVAAVALSPGWMGGPCPRGS